MILASFRLPAKRSYAQGANPMSKKSGTVQDRIYHPLLAEGELRLGEFVIPCAVVQGPDGKPVRVLSGRQFERAIGRNRKGERQLEVQENQGDFNAANKIPEGATALLPEFLLASNIRQLVTPEIVQNAQPLWFRDSHGRAVRGQRAELLSDVCDTYLTARDAGLLNHHLPNVRQSQEQTAERCYHLMRAFARVGITALVDEATGFQEIRAKNDLQLLVDAFLGEKAAPWQRTFGTDFYREAHRLYGLSYTPGSQRHPVVIGQFTKEVIYNQILPAPVHNELLRRNPVKYQSHVREFRHHQWLTPESRQRLSFQLHLVINLMRASVNIKDFRRLMAKAMPKSQMSMFDEE
jgi:hypothetical protein